MIHVAFALMTGVVPASGSQADSTDDHVVMVAHRGGLDHGLPENTLAAFRHALQSGVDVIEIDLRGTKDGAVVVIHDKTVDRTTNGSGQVADKTLAELRKLDAGSGERIPTYEEVLKLVAGSSVRLLLDIKESAVLDREQVVRLTERYDAIARVIVGPRSVEDLRAFRALNANLRTLGFVEEIEDIEAFVEAGADIIRLWPAWIEDDPGLIAKVHRIGKPVWATTGNAPRAELEKLIKLGVDGLISDWPKVMQALRAEIGTLRAR